MIKQITSGWNFIRATYLLLGIIIVAQSIMSRQWLPALFGVYFASMGLFNYGCAAGTCTIPYKNKDKKSEDINF